jgi:hypothetical protein
MQKPYYRRMRAQWLNAFSAGFERDSRPRSMSAGGDSDAHWVCDAHELTLHLFGSMVRRRSEQVDGRRGCVKKTRSVMLYER